MNTMNRTQKLFSRCKAENRKALIAKLAAGFPTMDFSVEAVDRIVEAGADIIVLDAPFSDPMSEGPAFRLANQIALQNGATLHSLLQACEEIRRRRPDAPLFLYSYFNVFLAFGMDELCRACKRIGIDGLIVADMPVEMYDQAVPLCEKHGVGFVPIITSKTNIERAKTVLRKVGNLEATFFYSASLGGDISQAKNAIDLPLAGDFEISGESMEQIRNSSVDAVALGNVFMTPLTESPNEEGLNIIAKLAREIRQSI